MRTKCDHCDFQIDANNELRAKLQAAEAEIAKLQRIGDAMSEDMAVFLLEKSQLRTLAKKLRDALQTEWGNMDAGSKKEMATFALLDKADSLLNNTGDENE